MPEVVPRYVEKPFRSLVRAFGKMDRELAEREMVELEQAINGLKKVLVSSGK